MKIDHSKILSAITNSDGATLALANQDRQEQAKRAQSVEGERFINALFDRLKAICPAHKQAYPTTEELNSAKREWMDKFYVDGVSKKSSIDYAIEQLKSTNNPFFPTVGQFIEWCHEGDLPEGTLSARDAYDEWLQYDAGKIKISDLSQPTFHTRAVIFGSGMQGMLTTGKSSDCLKYWISRYTQTMDKMKAGKPLKDVPLPAEQLEHIRVPGKRSTMENAMELMRKGL